MNSIVTVRFRGDNYGKWIKRVYKQARQQRRLNLEEASKFVVAELKHD